VREWHALGGSGNIPLETTGGLGTCDSRWRKSVFSNELMTGFIGTTNPLSRVGVGSMQDLGIRSTMVPPTPIACLREPPALSRSHSPSHPASSPGGGGVGPQIGKPPLPKHGSDTGILTGQPCAERSTKASSSSTMLFSTANPRSTGSGRVMSIPAILSASSGYTASPALRKSR